jgi:hypothetical protein
MRGARNPCNALRPRVRACEALLANPAYATACNQKTMLRRAFVLERQGAPYIAVFQIGLRFNAVTGVTSRGSAPVTRIPLQDQPCNGCYVCYGEKWITSPLSLPDAKGRRSRLEAFRKEKPWLGGESGKRKAKGQALERERSAEPLILQSTEHRYGQGY